MTNKVLCIYHGNCADGFGAAWAVRHGYQHALMRPAGDLEFHPGIYGKAPPDCRGKHILLVDFSYKRDVMEQIISEALSVFVIDHHVTAEKELAAIKTMERFHCIFDMEQSGAVLTWKHFMPHDNVPTLLKYIQDRDLWQFKLPGSREIAATIFSHPYDFDVWDTLVLEGQSPHHLERMMSEGRAIERKHFKDINELIAVTKRRMIIGGHDVPVANLPYTMSSDAGHIMSTNEPFAACYIDRTDDRMFSLRSGPNGEDVSKIAASYGGGGHKNAAGFQAPLGWSGDNVEIISKTLKHA